MSKLIDYGSLILAHMAAYPNDTMNAENLARAVLLPPATVRKLLKILVKGGLLISSLGKRGGYQLVRPAAEISLAEIIIVLEGAIALTEYAMEKRACSIGADCNIRQNWRGVNQIIYQNLAQVSQQETLPLRGQACTISSAANIKRHLGGGINDGRERAKISAFCR